MPFRQFAALVLLSASVTWAQGSGSQAQVDAGATRPATSAPAVPGAIAAPVPGKPLVVPLPKELREPVAQTPPVTPPPEVVPYPPQDPPAQVIVVPVPSQPRASELPPAHADSVVAPAIIPQPDVPKREPSGLEPPRGVPPVAPSGATAALEPASNSRAYLNGHPREGAFLSGPGSLAFVMHHTLMGATGGLATQIASHGFNLALSSREAMLAGTLVGAGLGFGFSAWWQFNHWVGAPAAHFGIINSVISGMFFTGAGHLFTQDPVALSWTALLGAELGAWLTATIGGGEMPVNQGLLIASGGAWALAYTSLLLAIVGTSSTTPSANAVLDASLIAPGIGAGLLALATLKYHPTTAQILRADLFGAGVGGAVLVLSALVLGNFKIATPYVLSMLSSMGAIAAVSIFWEESAEHQPLLRNPALDQPYRSLW